MAEEERARLRVVDLSQKEKHRDVADMTPGERLGLMWQLALDAWAFQGNSDDAESGLQRHVVRVRRRTRDLADIERLENEAERSSREGEESNAGNASRS